MTRESKLALILSFVLILVVGVLISDHFSQASSMRAGIDAPGDGVDPPPPRGPATPLPESGGGDAIARDDPPQSRGSVLERLGESFGSLDDAPELAQPASEKAETGSGDEGPVVIVNERPEPDENGERPTTRVRPGESLYAIARRTLGDGERWREIQRLNRDTLGDSTTVRIGMRLTLPSGADAEAPSDRGGADRDTAGAARARTHTVQPGEYLGMIAQEYLGTVSRMDEIVELNGLDDADDIRVGMTLEIPPE